MTEVKIASRTCPDEFGRPRTFHYSLTVDTVESNAFSCENYGVRISEESGDTAAIPGITTSAVRIDELMTLLVEHGVSPTALPDIIADWLSQDPRKRAGPFRSGALSRFISIPHSTRPACGILTFCGCRSSASRRPAEQ